MEHHWITRENQQKETGGSRSPFFTKNAPLPDAPAGGKRQRLDVSGPALDSVLRLSSSRAAFIFRKKQRPETGALLCWEFSFA